MRHFGQSSLLPKGPLTLFVPRLVLALIEGRISAPFRSKGSPNDFCCCEKHHPGVTPPLPPKCTVLLQILFSFYERNRLIVRWICPGKIKRLRKLIAAKLGSRGFYAVGF